ncbi:MAG TPA: Hsp20/alpha crystallin family protein [Ktedonobacterales bacterium]|nr:Hsp20/alpha crystallin family protein [Ktedonobacterales bacterium]
MSSLTRWDPMSEMTGLREAMDQLLERAVVRPGLNRGLAGNNLVASYGAMNVFETGGRYVCQALLPGALPDDIDLTVRQNTLTLKAKLPEPVTEQQQKGATYLLREFGGGEFTRSIAFPKDVQGDDVQARFENGILAIEVPIARHAQPRRITIQSVQSASDQRVERKPEHPVVDETPAAPELTGANAVANNNHNRPSPSASSSARSL